MIDKKQMHSMTSACALSYGDRSWHSDKCGGGGGGAYLEELLCLRRFRAKGQGGRR